MRGSAGPRRPPLAGGGASVFVACRSESKGRAAVAAIVAVTGNPAVAFLPLDLADLASVRRGAGEFLARGQPLHALINNAGVGGQRGITADGFELAFGVNHLGHFALTAALTGRLVDSAPARVVTVASDAHYQATGVDLAAVRQPTELHRQAEYAVSKLCNVLFSRNWPAGRSRGITSYALHPGVVASTSGGGCRGRAAADQAADAFPRAGRGDVAVLRHLTRGERRERPLLRGLPGPRAQQGRNCGAGPSPLGT